MKKAAIFLIATGLLFAMGPGGGMGKGMGMGQGAGQGMMQQRDIFGLFDRNKDGKISKAEWQKQRQKRMQEQAKEERMLKNSSKAPNFEAIDKNGDGFIDRNELHQYRALKRQKMMQQNR